MFVCYYVLGKETTTEMAIGRVAPVNLTFTSMIVASHNYNTPTASRRGATLSATYLGGHLTFTSITQLQHTNSRSAWGYTYQLPIWGDTSRLLAITDMLTDRQTDRQTDKTDRHTDRQTEQ